MKQNKLTLLVLAAGMGSRYGSLKQVDRIGPSGETITVYSVYDAVKAGFDKVVFVIRKNIEKDFKELFSRISKHVEVEYVFQELDEVPEGISINPERQKPWGTGHAVLVASSKINTPFAVINADDFYGADSYKIIASHLLDNKIEDDERFCMIGYRLNKTLSEHGHVSRGICVLSEDNYLLKITERTKIQYDGNKVDNKIVFIDEQNIKHSLIGNEIVSMNFWGFPIDIFDYLREKFYYFIHNYSNDLKAEFYLPIAMDELIHEGKAKVKVLTTPNDWFGVTYKEDKEITINKIKDLIKEGKYPSKLW